MPRLIVAGLVVFGLFVVLAGPQPARAAGAALAVPRPQLRLANVAISAMGFAITALAFPLMLYAQLVRGLSPTGAALLLVPMALMSIVLAPLVGRLTDRVHPRLITGAVGFSSAIVSLVWLRR